MTAPMLCKAKVAAHELGVSKSTIKEWRKAGVIPYIDIGNGLYRYQLDQLLRLEHLQGLDEEAVGQELHENMDSPAEKITHFGNPSKTPLPDDLLFIFNLPPKLLESLKSVRAHLQFINYKYTQEQRRHLAAYVLGKVCCMCGSCPDCFKDEGCDLCGRKKVAV